VAPAHLVQEFAHMIAMVFHPQSAFDQVGNPLRGPQLRPVSMCHGPFSQEMNESRFLFQCQSGWPACRRLGLQGIRPTGSQSIAPTENTTRVATHTSGDLMKGQFLFEERNHTTPTLFKRSRRTFRSHGDTPFQDVSIILYYLCGSQYVDINKYFPKIS
jgi:hypothetical protein